MKKVCVVGHFGFGQNMFNGQTIKTKIITKELEKEFGTDRVMKIDTHGGIKGVPQIITKLLYAFVESKNIIILPAHNGIRVIVPLCVFINYVFHRKIHYIVIGGWLNEFLNKHKCIEKQLKKFTGIYVETNTMKKKLNARGLKNIYVMPNFKDINILAKDELIYSNEEPFKLCTFSRVMKEKGICEAIDGVKAVNEKYGRTVFSLDIYGQIDSGQEKWFEDLKNSFPEYINYKGVIAFDQSVNVLKRYYALLFLTYYEGEGFAGTLLDAMAAGVPTIASNWKYNNEIVDEGKTGMLVEVRNQKNLYDILLSGMNAKWNKMKIECITKASRYTPKKAIQILIEKIR